MIKKVEVVSLNVGRLFYLYGFGLWMTIITLNNINDPGTNAFYINNMLEMNQFDLAKSDIGKGLLWRSLKIPYLANVLLWGVVLVELIIDFFMWRAFFRVLKDILRGRAISADTVSKVNVALCWMLGLFICFLTGGIWFCYWIYMGAFQMVHFTGL